MTDEEAAEALKALAKHYRQPVLPLDRFCAAITTWFRAIEQNNTDPALRRGAPFLAENTWRPEYQHGHSYAGLLPRIETDIHKSYLLARLIYGGEKLRTRMCPLHLGHWDGPAQLGFPDQVCPHGCGGAGWLPEPEDDAKPQATTPSTPFVAIGRPIVPGKP